LERLSTFWRRRLTMLLSTSQSSPHLSRLTALAIVLAAIGACLLPTLRYGPVQAQSQQAQRDAKAKGRIYVTAGLRLKDEDKTRYNLLIAMDTLTGKWQTIADKGHDARVSPNGRTLVFSRLDDGIWCESPLVRTVWRGS